MSLQNDHHQAEIRERHARARRSAEEQPSSEHKITQRKLHGQWSYWDYLTANDAKRPGWWAWATGNDVRFTHVLMVLGLGGLSIATTLLAILQYYSKLPAGNLATFCFAPLTTTLWTLTAVVLLPLVIAGLVWRNRRVQSGLDLEDETSSMSDMDAE